MKLTLALINISNDSSNLIINKDSIDLKGSCFFNQSVYTKRRFELLSQSIVHDRKFTIWWYLIELTWLSTSLDNMNKYFFFFLIQKIFQANLSWFHSPSSKFYPFRNYLDVQIHENYNHPISLLQSQMNSCSLSWKAAAPNVMVKVRFKSITNPW